MRNACYVCLIPDPWSLIPGHWSLVTGHWSLVIRPSSVVRVLQSPFPRCLLAREGRFVMEAGTRKAELLATLEAEHAAWRALLEAIGADRMQWPGAAGLEWTVQDVIAHLTAWRGRTLARLQAGLAHTAPAPGPWPAAFDENDPAGVGQINAWFYQADRGRPLAAVLAESEASWQALADLVRALPEAD